LCLFLVLLFIFILFIFCSLCVSVSVIRLSNNTFGVTVAFCLLCCYFSEKIRNMLHCNVII
jgi:hypothetical protein